MMSLFLDDPKKLFSGFDKTSAFVARLSDKHENWPQEILSELMRRLPFLSDYEVNTHLTQVDSTRGFAFGYADVSSKTERPEEEHEEHGIPHIRVPLIVENKAVKPFSVYVDMASRKIHSLTEDKIRQVLFSPTAFDISSIEPKDPSLVDPLMPPNRSAMGLGGDTKTASVKTSKSKLIDAVSDSFLESHKQAFLTKVSSDPAVLSLLKNAHSVQIIAHAKIASADEFLENAKNSVTPTAMTIHRISGDRFLIKSANENSVVPDQAKGNVVDAATAGQVMGPENAVAMAPGQTVSVGAGMAPVEEEEENNDRPVTEFGQWSVTDAVGNRILGWVFPECRAWDGAFSPVPVSLFTNGSAYAFQDSMVGELVGKSSVLPVDEPRGDGTFYKVDGGKAKCMVPITIKSLTAGPDGMPKFIGNDLMGQQVVVSVQDGLAEPFQISDMEFALPPSWKFMRLNNQTQLAQGAGPMGAEEAPTQAPAKKPAPKAEKKDATKGPKEGKPAKKAPEKVETKTVTKTKTASANTVTLRYNGQYQLHDGCGLEKLSLDLTENLDKVSAEFMLTLLGVPEASELCDRVVSEKIIKISAPNHIRLFSENRDQAIKTASSLINSIPWKDLRLDLIKEAALIKMAAPEDEGSVDDILALNMVNSENIMTFLEYIPELEETSSRLASMLLSCYLGKLNIPEEAVERAMRGMDKVVTSLKALSHSEE